MEFPDLGKHCCVQTCNRLDFLPMKCDACTKIFCKNHIKYDEHNCESSYHKDVQVPVCPLCNKVVSCPRNEEPDKVISAHIDRDCKSDPALRRPRIYKNRCSASNCKQREAIAVHCDKCLKTYCLKHRFPEDHKCNGFENTGRQMSRTGAAAIDRLKSFTTNTSVKSSTPSAPISVNTMDNNNSQITNNNAATTAVTLNNDLDDLQELGSKMSIEDSDLQQYEDYLLAKALQESEEEIRRSKPQ
ncbi:unnamed protein product, partial [Didymodactylos carnosus]